MGRMWSSALPSWTIFLEERLLSSEWRTRLLEAIDALPRLPESSDHASRDVEGWPPEDVCEYLDVADGNQRVLLHRHEPLHAPHRAIPEEGT